MIVENPLNTTMAIMLALSVLANCLLVLWGWTRAKGTGSVLLIWTGRGLIPKPVKPGQKRYMWTRPDKSRCAFSLLPEYGMGYGTRGQCWLADGANGRLMKWNAEEKLMVSLDPADTPAAKRTWRDVLQMTPEEQDTIPTGAMMRLEFDTAPMQPDGNKMAQVMDDDREEKWFLAQTQADKGKFAIKPLYLIIGAVVIFYFLQSKGMIHF